jgi:hypothetical protein
MEGIRNWLQRMPVISDKKQVTKMAVIMKSTISLDVTPSSMVEIY